MNNEIKSHNYDIEVKWSKNYYKNYEIKSKKL